MSGNDDQRMKDLAKRIVAMSPEPPPYPEEVTVTQPQSSKPSPVLIFAGAAVIVLILAAIPILLLGGGGEVDPVATTTTSTVPTSEDSEPVVTTTIESTTSTEPATTTTTPVVNTSEVVLFLVATPDNSFTGNPALVPFRTATVSNSSSLVDDSVMALANPDIVLPDGFMNMVPAGIEVIGSEMRPEEHMVVLDLNQAFLAGAGGLLADFTMLNQLVYTATHDGPFDAVLFTVEGEPVTAFGSEGLDLSQPVGKDAFLDQVNSILLTAPVEGQTGAPLTVTGVANVFEATVSLEIVDQSGAIVHEQFTTATCGTGCWGEFIFEVDYTPTGGETVRVFWNSPEDGAPADVVTVPLLFDSEVGWELIPLS